MIYKPEFFKLYELVCPSVYNKFGDMSWQFFDEKALVTLDWVRKLINKPITVNTWKEGGEFDERGLRCIQCNLVKTKCLAGAVYLSPHILGKAFDFDVQGMTAAEVRLWLASKQNLIPYPIRLEKDVNWVHLDVEDAGSKVFLFNP